MGKRAGEGERARGEFMIKTQKLGGGGRGGGGGVFVQSRRYFYKSLRLNLADGE